MINVSVHYLELLKNKVIEQAGWHRITAGDCRALSFMIIQRTRQRLSETTLKRLYGFAQSRFQPSTYTLDALAQYCGFDGWESWQQQDIPVPVQNAPPTWAHLRQNAAKVSENTVQAMRNRSGIPYHYTINRACIDTHMHDFLASGLTGTVLYAPAGYGKSVGICRWVEQQMAIPHGQDIFLYFSSTALVSTALSGRNLHDWIQGLLGYGDIGGITSPDDVTDRGAGRFWLVVDGFDEHRFRTEQFDLVLEQLTDVFARYQKSDHFKLVITMRTASWKNNRHQMLANNGGWFIGDTANSGVSNVSIFDLDEIRELAMRINPDIQFPAVPHLPPNFGVPLYLDYYYQQHKKNMAFDRVDEISLYEINALFVLNQVYLGKYAEEKVRLITQIVRAMHAGTNDDFADKILLDSLSGRSEQAFKELVSSGYLVEVNESETYNYRLALRFGSNCLLSHAIARTWLHDNGNIFNSLLINRISGDELPAHLRLPVIKWCILDAVKTGQQKGLDHLFELRVNPVERMKLVNFIAGVLRHESALISSDEAAGIYLDSPFSQKLFEYFFGLEMLSPAYHRSLNALLLFRLSEKQQVFVYTAMGINALISLNVAELENWVLKLQRISAKTYDALPLNPATCLHAFLMYFRYGLVDREALTMLTRFMAKPAGAEPQPGDQLLDMLYLLAAYTGYLFGSSRKLLRLVDKLGNCRCTFDEPVSGPYCFFIQVIKADVAFKTGQRGELDAIYQKLQTAFDSDEHNVTPFMDILFTGLKIKLLACSGQEKTILPELRHVEAITSQSGSKVSKLYILSLLLRNEVFLHDQPQFRKQFSYDIKRISRENALMQENFLTE